MNSTCHVEADPGCARRRPCEPLGTHTCTHTGPCGPPKTGEALAWSWPTSAALPWDRGCLMVYLGDQRCRSVSCRTTEGGCIIPFK